MPMEMPLSANGRFIVDAHGRRVRLAGVNWYGFHEDLGVAPGLDRTHRRTLAKTIALHGFNSVRLPFSVWMTEQTKPVPNEYLAANPDLFGATPMQVFDACVEALTGAGLIVIPNCHMLDPGWPVPETTQILTRSGWKYVTEVRPGEDETLGYQDGELLWTPITQVRRRGSQRVVRFGSSRWSTVCTPEHRWLTSTAFPRNRRPAEWGSVKGESAAQAWFSKLTPRGIAGARKLVLTGYAEGGKSGCTPDEARVAAWLLSNGSVTWRRDNNGVVAYIAQSEGKHADEIRELLAHEQACSSEVAPLWIGEFGNDTRSLANFGLAPSGQAGGGADAAVWWDNLEAWLTEYDVGWCWWALNPTQPKGTIPVTNQHRSNWGDPEGYGLLAPDWRGVVNPRVMDILKSMIPPRTGPGVG